VKLNVKQLTNAQGQPFAFEKTEHWGHLAHRGRPLAYTRDVHIQGEACWRKGIVFVSLELTTEIELECSRCLRALAFPVRLTESLEFHEEPEGDVAGILLDGFSYEHGAEELELMPYIEQLIAASLESKPLCRADCRGLCPSCGQDLNEGSCTCAQQRAADPRLEKLKDLLA
jgi:uncharacterized protein